jgi:hypothetical protein
MSRFSLITPLLVLAGVMLAGGGAAVMHLENEAYRAGGITSIDRAAAWTRADVSPGLSTPTIKLTMLDCINALNSPRSLLMRYQDTATQGAIPVTCRTLAETVTMHEPTFAYAWYAAALASARMEDWAAMNAALLRSEMASPTQSWIALERMSMIEDYFGHLDADGRLATKRDVALLVGGPGSLARIARIYVKEEGFRDLATEVVATLPDRAQRRFISEVRVQSQGGAR